MNDSSDINPIPPPLLPDENAEAIPPPTPIAPPVLPRTPVEPIREIPLDEQGYLSEAVPCRRCSYTLRGLAPSAQCPECALPVARSVLGDELRFCDPAWVNTMGQGIKLILIGVFSMIGLGVLLFAAMMIYVITSAVGTGAPPNMAIIMAGSMVITLPMLLAIFGTWRLTSPDPGQIDSEPALNVRKLARWCMMAVLVSTPLSIVTSQQFTMTPGTTTPMPTLTPGMQALQWTSFLFGTIALVGYVAVLIMLGRLANRIPNPSLVTQAKIVTWGFAITNGIAYAMGIVVNFMTPAFLTAMSAQPPQSPPVTYFVAAGGAGISGCISLVFLVWAIVLLFLVFFAVRKEAVKAQTHWGEG